MTWREYERAARARSPLAIYTLQCLRMTMLGKKALTGYWLGSRFRRTILLAGMPRSASTLLFNMTRVLLEQEYGTRVGAYWVGEIPVLAFLKSDVVLVKVHKFDQRLLVGRPEIIYSFRDVRDALASEQRMFDLLPTARRADMLIDTDKQWRDVSPLTFKYESLIADHVGAVKRLAGYLSVQAGDPAAVAAEVSDLHRAADVRSDQRHDARSLFHRDHVTDGTPGSWRTQLDPQVVDHVRTKHLGWLMAHGYAGGPIGDRQHRSP